ncbi:hypothetical protein DFH11DRAFT_1726335 [Phellopilus nigrolimitatus]|nr:hypothetical protein DFH11DRAFT_1726335 [Phellopilus nigrolimitatus]
MSNGARYDKALLDNAPEVTSQQRQRFYDADLLYDDANQQHGARNPNGTPAPGVGATAVARSNTLGRPNADVETGRTKEYAPLPPPSVRARPWYKSRVGILAIIVLVLVVIGAVVGGAVGGTQANKNKNGNKGVVQTTFTAPQSTASSSSSPPQSGGQGAGISGSSGQGSVATDSQSVTGSAPTSSAATTAAATTTATTATTSTGQAGVGQNGAENLFSGVAKRNPWRRVAIVD